jgi:hypothetical protein
MLNLHRPTSFARLYSSDLLLACLLYSSSLLLYSCRLLTHSFNCPLLRNLLTYEDAARTRLTETTRHIMLCKLWRHSACAICANKKNTHFTWPLPTVLWCHRGHKENAASPIVACAYFGRGLEMTSFYCCVLEHIYGAVAWQWVFMLEYREVKL